MIGSHFCLIDSDNIKVKFTDPSATILKPEDVDALVHVQVVLLGIAFEKLSLGHNIVLCLFFFLFIYKFSTISTFAAGLCHIWRNTDKILVTFRSLRQVTRIRPLATEWYLISSIGSILNDWRGLLSTIANIYLASWSNLWHDSWLVLIWKATNWRTHAVSDVWVIHIIRRTSSVDERSTLNLESSWLVLLHLSTPIIALVFVLCKLWILKHNFMKLNAWGSILFIKL